ncbi:polysaccharide deacetylase family protein [Roseateles sp. DXS20W]|uniref:Polysaccharide deacetylase family protein n=1 Tax=Pelomonas lactea TaxID=3299030 RepID=A0ABW7GI61_9BURK
MLKTALTLLSPAGAAARLTVLIFHRVHAAVDPLFPDEPDARRFDEVLGWLGAWFNVLPLDDAIRRLQAGSLPARAACITFDDGYADNHDVALPLLQRHGLSSAFFVASGFLDGGRMWNDTVIESVRRTQLPQLDLRGVVDEEGGRFDLGDLATRRQTLHRLIGHLKYLPPDERLARVNALAERAEVQPPTDLMMTSDQLRSLRGAGMVVGAHTVSHPILKTLSARQAADEIDSGRRWLEQALGERVSLFAYPNGRPGVDYAPDVHPGMVRELGFDAAVSTHWGAARAGTDCYQLPRFTPWDRGRARFGLRLARNLLTS